MAMCRQHAAVPTTFNMGPTVMLCAYMYWPCGEVNAVSMAVWAMQVHEEQPAATNKDIMGFLKDVLKQDFASGEY